MRFTSGCDLGTSPTKETARVFFENLFFNAKRYDLSRIGRLKLNTKLGLDLPLEKRMLTKEDVIEVVGYLLKLRQGNGTVDDIDHSGQSPCALGRGIAGKSTAHWLWCEWNAPCANG